MGKKEKGSSHSIRPVSKRPPGWCKYTPEEVEAMVVKLAKEGHPPSKIGVLLRDRHGIPLVKPIVGRSITRVLKEAGLAPPIPEDFNTLLEKAARLHVHLEKNKGDLHNKRAVQLVEAKIYKLARYYKREGLLPPDWKYQAKIASPL
ncbi:MAG: 30S ribosomal protein S15 [Candidatus Bathyarchaeota archaeon]|nr:MAG: 30S ribosomal protein S15 [Candidatus Bathyarchaeota archaeon]